MRQPTIVKETATLGAALGTILAVALSTAILAGCTGMVVISPEAWTGGIPASLATLPGKPDGEYRGSYTIALPAGSFAAFRHVAVDVCVASGSITTIELVEPEILRSAEFFHELPARIVAGQSLDVDAVSGVTFTSKALMKAVQNALEN
jgi:fumarate reductase flavoprotein subunit